MRPAIAGPPVVPAWQRAAGSTVERVTREAVFAFRLECNLGAGGGADLAQRLVNVARAIGAHAR
jgi:hypothetical protein